MKLRFISAVILGGLTSAVYGSNLPPDINININDPYTQAIDSTKYRMVVSSATIKALNAQTVASGKINASMYYDSKMDSGTPNYWNNCAVLPNWSSYLAPASALGSSGPLDFGGPLGSTGPLFNPFYIFSAWNLPSLGQFGPSTQWSLQQPPVNSDVGSSGMLSNSGPLGSTGPINENQLYLAMYHLNENKNDAANSPNDCNDFPHQLDPSGIWGVLGPLGPTGALGPLGPLGPLGVGKLGSFVFGYPNGNPYTYKDTQKKFKTGVNGEYLRDGIVENTIEVPQGNNKYRRFQLVEMYPRTKAIELSNAGQLDTSFSVNVAEYFGVPTSHSYKIKSGFDQFVAINVVRVNVSNSFTLEVSKNGTVLATTSGTELDYAPFVLIRTIAGETLTVKVSTTEANYGYLLHVVGSGFEESTDGAVSYQPTNLFAPRRTVSALCVAILGQSCPTKKTFNTTGAHQDFSNLLQ